MLVVKKDDFSREFNSTNLLKQKEKEVKTWQWIILLCCFLFQMFPYCVALNLTNVFMPTDWAVWTSGNQTIMSVTFTVGALGAAIVGPMIARIFGKEINMRLVYSIGVFLAMIGFFGTGVNALIPKEHRSIGAVTAILYIANFVSQVGVMVFSGLGVNNLISKWWPADKRGFALGIAFTGGSVGNIWMQQLVGVLAKTFGNSQGFTPEGTLPADNGSGYRWATYLILACMGLVTGIVIAIVACRKPVPPTEIFGFDGNNKQSTSIICVGCNNHIEKINKQALALEASPLVTKKYPPYWILAIGYLILQMGTIHAAMNGSFIKNATVIANPTYTYTDMMAVGGTLFGVFCLIGNFGGGILNDKIGPNKSIALAGIMQCASLLALLFSVQTPELVYLYFVLAGLSVYIYTSTPSFISGRLYGAGQSNNHMSILGIFIAVGFAIVNSIVGVITGPVNSSNQTELFGHKIFGNMLALVLFAIVCMAIGTIIVVICTNIIMRKGIKGLLEYSPTKYTRVVGLKSIEIWFSSLRIWLTGVDYRVNNEHRNLKIEQKSEKDRNFNTYAIYLDNLVKTLKNNNNKDLTKNQIKILAQIYLNKMITAKRLNALNLGETTELNALIEKGLVNEKQLGQQAKVYELNNSLLAILPPIEINNQITIENENIDHILEKIESKFKAKQAVLKEKLEAVQQIEINAEKQEEYNMKVEVKLAKLQSKKEILAERLPTMSDWKAYKAEYALLEQEYNIKKLKTKLEDDKKAKIAAVQKKMFIGQFITNYEKNIQIEGHNLLVNYYNNPFKHIDQLIDNNIKNAIERKISSIAIKKASLQNKYSKLLGKENRIFANNESMLETIQKESIIVSKLANIPQSQQDQSKKTSHSIEENNKSKKIECKIDVQDQTKTVSTEKVENKTEKVNGVENDEFTLHDKQKYEIK